MHACLDKKHSVPLTVEIIYSNIKTFLILSQFIQRLCSWNNFEKGHCQNFIIVV